MIERAYEYYDYKKNENENLLEQTYRSAQSYIFKKIYDPVEQYKKQQDYMNWRMNRICIQKPIYDFYWDKLLKSNKRVDEFLKKLKEEKEYADIKKFMETIKKEIININNQYIEAYDRNSFIDLNDKIVPYLNTLQKMKEANDFL